jgi:hypothetical protein
MPYKLVGSAIREWLQALREFFAAQDWPPITQALSLLIAMLSREIGEDGEADSHQSQKEFFRSKLPARDRFLLAGGQIVLTWFIAPKFTVRLQQPLLLSYYMQEA